MQRQRDDGQQHGHRERFLWRPHRQELDPEHVQLPGAEPEGRGGDDAGTAARPPAEGGSHAGGAMWPCAAAVQASTTPRTITAISASPGNSADSGRSTTFSQPQSRRLPDAFSTLATSALNAWISSGQRRSPYTRWHFRYPARSAGTPEWPPPRPSSAARSRPSGCVPRQTRAATTRPGPTDRTGNSRTRAPGGYHDPANSTR